MVDIIGSPSGSETSAVLAFITDADRALAERTLDLLPVEVPQARIEFAGGANALMLASLLAALRITGWAGVSRGIDPGRPGVPKFGRKLYHLRLPRPQRAVGLPRLHAKGDCGYHPESRRRPTQPRRHRRTRSLARSACHVPETVYVAPISQESFSTTTARW